MHEFNKEGLLDGAAALGISLSNDQSQKILNYLSLLATTNQSLNLTSIPEKDYITLHILDSLSLVKALDMSSITKVLDMGTGAGLPGIPLAICFENLSVTMVDARAKKLKFIDQVIKANEIRNAITLHARAEELAKDPQHFASYDLVVARALSSLKNLIHLLSPFLNSNGIIMAMKGPNFEQELAECKNSFKNQKLKLLESVEVKIPGSDVSRYLIKISK